MRIAMFLGGVAAVALGTAAIAQDPVLPDGPGKDQIVTACGACHALAQVTSQRHPSAQWADLVDQMIARGAQVSDADYPIVVEYLAKHYGPVPATVAATPKP